MEEKAWWQSRTIWSAAIGAICSIIAITGHNIDIGTQSNLAGAITDIANGVGIIAGIAATYYRTKSTTAIAPIKPVDVK
jgi:hypothetical protein